MALVKLAAPAAALLAASCVRFDATETIELVPASSWTATEIETLRETARCWNAQFGIRFEVVEAATTAQSVDLRFDDFTCWSASGRFTPGEPAQISVCPLARWPDAVSTPENVRLFTVLAHELGHAAGIRSEASDPAAVMGLGDTIASVEWRFRPPLAFEQADIDLMRAEVPDSPPPTCAGRTVLVEDAVAGVACGCELDTRRAFRHVMGYDEARGVTLLFGGYTRNTDGGLSSSEQTWTWDGTRWTDVTPAASPSPSPRNSAAMVYDAHRSRFVLFGGSTPDGALLADTWEWDGSTWTQITPPVSPPARSAAAMAYDPVRRRVVLFGGVVGPRDFVDDAWEYADGIWTEQAAGDDRPPARASAALAFDPVRGTLLLFGGYDGTYLADPWQWDGVTWEPVPGSSPSARIDPAVVTDAARGRITLLGGGNSMGELLADLWEWDGTAWTTIAAQPGPAGRTAHAVALDTARNRLVLVGGETRSLRPDHWEWDGARWQGFGYQQCGNGVLEIGEACDDGNLTPSDGCGTTCQLE